MQTDKIEYILVHRGNPVPNVLFTEIQELEEFINKNFPNRNELVVWEKGNFEEYKNSKFYQKGKPNNQA